MKKIFNIFLFFVLINFCLGCCSRITSTKSKESNYLKKELGIASKDYEKIEGDYKIIEELKLAVKDSLIREKTSSILDSFFLEEKYSKERLLAILELNRFFKGSNYKIISTKAIDSNKVLIINNLEDLQKLKDILNENKVKVKTDTSKVKN